MPYDPTQDQGMDPSGVNLPGMDENAIARQRRMAQALLARGLDYSPIQSPWQGAARLADSLVGTYQNYSADKAERLGQQAVTKALSSGGDLATVGKSLAATPYGRSAGQALMLEALKARQPTEEFRTLKTPAGGEELVGITKQQGQPAQFTPYQVPGVGGGPTTKGEAAVDQKYAADLTQWMQGGFAETQSGIESLDKAISDLKTKKNISGPTIGYLVRQPRGSVTGAVAANQYPDAFDVMERHKRAVAASLKSILGARPAESVINQVIESTYDPSLPQETNANRLQILRDNLARSAKAKQGAAEYFTKNGTLTGYKGKVPDINDFLSDNPAVNAPPVPGATRMNYSPSGNARPMPSDQKLAILKANANNPEARKAFDEIFGAGAADHFLQGGQ
jgi:hypothetical protein